MSAAWNRRTAQLAACLTVVAACVSPVSNAGVEITVSINNVVNVTGLRVRIYSGSSSQGSLIDQTTTVNGHASFTVGAGDYVVQIDQPTGDVDCDALEKPITTSSGNTRSLLFECNQKPPVAVYAADASAVAQPAKNGVQVGPIQAGLKNANGNPVAKAGVAVTAALTTQGAVLSGNTSGVTGANGLASIGPFTITGPVASGPHTLALTSAGLVAATITGIQLTAGLPASMAAIGPTTITGAIGDPGVSVGVTVKDVSNNPVPVINITFTPSGGPTVTAASTVTNAAGQAQTTVNFAAQAGSGTVRAQVVAPGVQVPSLDFSIQTQVPDVACTHIEFAQLDADTHFFGDGGSDLFAAAPLGPVDMPCAPGSLDWSVTPATALVTVDANGRVTISPAAPVGDYTVTATYDHPLHPTLTASGVIHIIPRPAGTLFFAMAGQIYSKAMATTAAPVQLTTTLTGTVLGLTVDQNTGRIFFGLGTGGQADIFRMNSDGTGLLNITNSPASLNQLPALNPVDGDVFFSRVSGGAQGIFRMKQDGSSLGQLTPPGGPKITPAVSPNGQSYAWAQDVGGGNYEIFTSTITPHTPVRITTRAGNDAYPFWLTNTQLLWTGDAGGGNFDLFSQTPIGTGPILNLTNASSSEVKPKAGCLPNTVTIVSDRQGKPEIYLLDTSNSGLVRMLLVPQAITEAAWLCH